MGWSLVFYFPVAPTVVATVAKEVAVIDSLADCSHLAGPIPTAFTYRQFTDRLPQYVRLGSHSPGYRKFEQVQC